MNVNKMGLHITTMTVEATGISPNSTVRDLAIALRRDFENKMKRNEHFLAFKASANRIRIPRSKASYIDVSNVGYFETTGPFVDCWLQQSMTGKGCMNSLEFAAATLYGSQKARLLVRLPWSPLVFTRSDGIRMFKAITHNLTQLNPKLTISEAIREIREIAV
jgi:hypothetical protein